MKALRYIVCATVALAVSWVAAVVASGLAVEDPLQLWFGSVSALALVAAFLASIAAVAEL